MPLEKIETPYFRDQLSRLQQGDIFRELSISEVADISEEGAAIVERSLPYCLVLSQDCDLEQDFNSISNPRHGKDGKDDKLLPALLLCPAYLYEHFCEGKHLTEQGKMMLRIVSEERRKIKTNQVYRYHYLEPWPDLQVPELVVDFKHYFTVPRGILYRQECRSQYLATVEILYREHLSSRFAHYLSRVGLPELTSP